ncbi:MAG: YhdP family protein [Thalassotalea sp.]
MKTSKVLHYSLRWLYKSIAILLVAIAVLISCLRLFLPYAQNYRTDLQNYINDTYQTNVVIGHLNTGWAAKGPTLLVEKISLVNAGGLEIFIGNFEVEIDFWKSLQHRQLITTNFTIDQAKVFIDPKNIDNKPKNSGDRVILEQLSDLFLTQIPRFKINNSQVSILVAGSIQNLSISQLSWMNKGKKHQGKGEVIVNGLSSKKLKLLIDIDGNSQEKLSGQAYFEANNIDISPWLNDFIVTDNGTESAINFQSWLKIEKGTAKQLIVNLGENHISWLQGQAAKKLTLDKGYFVIEASDSYDYLGIYSSPIHWQVNDNNRQAFEFNAHLAYGNFSGFISQLDIESALALNPLFFDDINTQSTLADLGAVGYLENIFFKYQQDLKIVTDYKDISIDYHNSIPGVERLSGTIAYQRNKVLIDVEGEDGALDFGPHFNRPIPYNQLRAQTLLTIDDGLLAQVNDISLSSDELSFSGDVTVNIPKTGEAAMALLAHVDNGKGKFAKHYYPPLLMGNDLVNYLDRAITDGQLSEAEIIFDGKFNDFPFTDKPGLFNVNAKLLGSHFVFDDSWPAIDKLDATLDFTNNSMLITAHSGTLAGLAVNGVEVAIADLANEQILTVSAGFTKQLPEHVAALMNGSSLANSVGEVLNTAVFSEPISGEFSLNLPLNNSDAAVAQGKIKFSDNDLQLTSPEMLFSNLYGELSFRNDVIKVAELRANWRGMPITFHVDAKDYKDFYLTSLKFHGVWRKELWRIELPESLQKYIDGELDWQGELSLFNPHHGEFSYQLGLSSNLSKNAFHLPPPYRKLSGQSSTLSADVEGGGGSSNIQVKLDEQLSFYGDLSHKDTAFRRAHLVLGKEKMMMPLEGFHITTMLENASVSEWQPFVSDVLAAIPDNKGNEQSLLGQPERIRGTVGSLTLFAQQFNDVSFNLVDHSNWWQLEMNAKELRSQIKFYPDWHQQGVDINLDFLNIAEQETQEALAELAQELVIEQYEKGRFDKSNTDYTASDKANAAKKASVASVINHSDNQMLFVNMPPISFNCGSCKLGKFDFGKVSFDIKKETEKLLKLKNFQAQRKGIDFKISGQWLMEDDYSSTQISGDLAIKKIESEMDKMGFASIIKDSGAELNFDINWLGGFNDFAFNSLNGQIHSELNAGYLADVSDAARIFSILSLQSLVRKLTFDFRDIFSDGMFYSQIKGDSVIENGVIYTDNMKMKGSAGDLWMKGNTNLMSGGLDYRMSYKPNLTSSLPVLGWIATLNPVAIIAGVAIDEVITSNVVSEFTFELTGSIEEPDLKEVNRKNKNISVGRSTPPKEVEFIPAPSSSGETKITPLKQYAPIYENNDG